MVNWTDLIQKLPENIRQLYELNEKPFDFSGAKGIHTKDFDYYPSLFCAIVDDILVYWDKDRPYVKPNIPEHLAALKERIAARRFHTIGIIHKVKHDPQNKIYCILSSEKTDVSGLEKIAFDNSWIYYDSNEVDMQNETTQTLAKVLFASQRYDAEYIIPSADKNPAHWE